MRSDIVFYTPPGTLVDPLAGWTPTTASREVMPLCTKLSFLQWIPNHIKFRIAECNTARVSSYYFAQAGNDTTGSGSAMVPWKSLAKAQQTIDAAPSGNIALFFAEGDVWREVPALTALNPTITQGTTAIFLGGGPPVAPRVGMYLTLQNSTTGARQLVTVTAYNSTNKMVTFSETVVGTYNRCAVNQCLYIDKPNVTVSTYRPSGSTTAPGAKAHFTAFQTPYDTSWTTSSSGTTYWRNDSGALTGFGWVRPTFDTSVFPLRQVGNAWICATSSGSWCASGTIVYVNDWNGEVLNDGDRSIEAAYRNYYEGIVVRDVDGTYINNIMLSGYGAGAPGDRSYDGYSIHLRMTGTNRAVVHNCEAYYAGRHLITHTGGGSGGIFTVVGCRMGWCITDGLPVVGYGDAGRNQMVCAFNTFVGGTAPSGNTPFTHASNGYGYYSHTATGSADLLLGYRNEFLVGPFMCWGGAYGNPGSWSDLANCKSFIVGERWPARPRTEYDSLYVIGSSDQIIGESFGSAQIVIINSEINFNHVGATLATDQSLWNSVTPFLVNCLVINDFEGRKGTRWSSSFRSLSGGSTFGAAYDSMRIYYSAMLFRVPEVNCQVGMIGRLINTNDGARNTAGTGNATGSGKVFASVIGLDNGGVNPNFSLGFNNNSTNIRGNAYVRPWYSDKAATYSGYSNDPDYVELSHYIIGRPFTSQLNLVSPITVEGYTLEYDKDGVPRNSVTARGPWETLP